MENSILPEILREPEKLEALLNTMKRAGYQKDLGITRAEFDEVERQLEEQMERLVYKKTAGYEKMENFVKDLARKPKFIEFLKAARKKFGIPEGGFDYLTAWKNQDKRPNKIWNSEEFTGYVDKYVGEHKMPGLMEFIASYILYNDIEPVSNELGIPIIKVTDITPLSGEKTDDAAIETKKRFPLGKVMDEFQIAFMGTLLGLAMDSKSYPIGIFIHPYMSQRDILDAIKKIYKTHIEPLQKKHRKEGVKLGKVRRKSKRAEERNKFIYENRFMPRKELASLVAQKFGEFMDYTYLNKILRDEREKNK